MILTTQKHFVFPLQEKIKIAGLRVETGREFRQEVVSGKIRLADNWNIQIVYTSITAPAQGNPSLLEFPVLWEDEYDWKEDYPDEHLTFSYKKAPSAVSAHIREENRAILLDLTLEGTIAVELRRGKAGLADGNAGGGCPTPPSLAGSAALTSVLRQAGAWEEKVGVLEEKAEALEKKSEALEKKVRALTESIRNLEAGVQKLKDERPATPALKCRLSGTILDDFRMIPIPKSILELYSHGTQEACAKTASDNRGYYSCEELLPGNYEIRIKHPRFLPLVIKDFTIREGESKYQDFILRRT